jgi:hypothetical protein
MYASSFRLSRAFLLAGTAAFAGLPALATGVKPVSLPSVEGRVEPIAEAPRAPATVQPLAAQEIDLPSLGIVATAEPKLRFGRRAASPLANVLGTLNAFTSTTSDLVPPSTSKGLGIVHNGFAPSETVNIYLNGSLSSSPSANASGRLLLILNVGAGLGYITEEAVGVTSGKITGAVFEVVAGSLPPGLAAGPHAIQPGDQLALMGTRFAASTTVNLKRNGAAYSSTPSDASGYFAVGINTPMGADTSAVYTADTGVAGSLAGQSVEERADAGSDGNNSLSRLLVDRAVTPGGTLIFGGEGFQPGETAMVSGCGSLSLTVNSNGAVQFFNGVSGAGVTSCVMTGNVSGRVGRASALIDSDATNVPGILVLPSQVSGSGTFFLTIARATPSQSGNTYVDGVNVGSFALDGGGKGSVLVPKPASGVLHSVRWVGSSDSLSGVVLTNVNTPPAVFTQPVDDTACAGSAASFSSTAIGSPTPARQWQRSTDGGGTWTAIAGATGLTYSFTASLADNAHFYRALYYSEAGSVTSNAATVRVDVTPFVTMNPSNATSCVSPNATFSVGATGGDLSYQWQVSSGSGYSDLTEFPPYSGVLTSTLTITGATAALNGNAYRCMVTNACASTSSAGALLTVDTTFPVVTPPPAATVTQSICQ